MVDRSWPCASARLCEELKEDDAPFSSFCTRRCNLEVSDVWVEVAGEVEEGEEVDGLGKGGNGKGSR